MPPCMGNTIAAVFFAYRLSLSKDFTENQVNVIIITKKGTPWGTLRKEGAPRCVYTKIYFVNGIALSVMPPFVSAFGYALSFCYATLSKRVIHYDTFRLATAKCQWGLRFD